MGSRTPRTLSHRGDSESGGIEGIRTGSAIVGTPQDGGVVTGIGSRESAPYAAGSQSPGSGAPWVTEAARLTCRRRTIHRLLEGEAAEAGGPRRRAQLKVDHCIKVAVCFPQTTPRQEGLSSRAVESGRRPTRFIDRSFPPGRAAGTPTSPTFGLGWSRTSLTCPEGTLSYRLWSVHREDYKRDPARLPGGQCDSGAKGLRFCVN